MGGVRLTLGLHAECTKWDGKYTEREERKPKRSIIFSCCQGNSHPELQQSTNSTFLLFIKCVCVWVCWAGVGGADLQTQVHWLCHGFLFYFEFKSSIRFCRVQLQFEKSFFSKAFSTPTQLLRTLGESFPPLAFICEALGGDSTELLSGTWQWQGCHFSNTAVHWLLQDLPLSTHVSPLHMPSPSAATRP